METTRKLLEKYETAAQCINEVTPVYYDLDRREKALKKALTGLETELPELLAQQFLGKVDSSRVQTNQQLSKRTKHELSEIELALPILCKRLDAASHTKRNCLAKTVNAFNRVYAHIEGGSYTDADIETFKAITEISTHRDHALQAEELLATLSAQEENNVN